MSILEAASVVSTTTMEEPIGVICVLVDAPNSGGRRACVLHGVHGFVVYRQ